MRLPAIIILFVILAAIGAGLAGQRGGNGSAPPASISPSPSPQTAKPLSLDFLSITSSDAPTLGTVVPGCALKPQVSLVWESVAGAAEYIIARNQIAIARVVGTTYIDTGVDLPQGLIPGNQYCYSIRSKTTAGSPDGKEVVSGPSNTRCTVAVACSGGGGITPGVPTPTPTRAPTATPTPTLTPTRTPTPTIPPADPRCAPKAFTTDGTNRPVITVKTFGAKGDGSSDDRDAIQEALNCFKTDPKGGAIYIPAGTYIIANKHLTIYSNEILFGDDTGTAASLQSKTILKLQSTKDYLIFNDRTYGKQNITIRNITLRGLDIDDLSPEGERCCAGIEFHNLTGGYIIDTTVEGFNDNGIHFDRYITENQGVNNVVISGCKTINNKRSGIAINNGTDNVINNCIVTGNNKGQNNSSWATNKNDAGLQLELGKAGIVARNKVISSTVSNNGIVSINAGGGINVGRAFNTRGDPKYILENNAVCNNTVENNGDVGIAEANGTGDVFIANVIRNNLDRRDGKIVICDEDVPGRGCQNYGNNAFEDENPNATHPACDISGRLNTISSLPPQVQAAVPVAVQKDSGSFFSPVINFFYTLFGGK